MRHLISITDLSVKDNDFFYLRRGDDKQIASPLDCHPARTLTRNTTPQRLPNVIKAHRSLRRHEPRLGSLLHD